VPHVCSVRPPRRQHTPASISASPRSELFPPPHVNGTAHEAGTVQKRKASPKVSVDTRAEKRIRTEDVEMHLDEPGKWYNNTSYQLEVYFVVSVSRAGSSKTVNHTAEHDEVMEMDKSMSPKRDMAAPPDNEPLEPSRISRIEEPSNPVTLLQGHEAEVNIQLVTISIPKVLNICVQVFGAAWNPAHPNLLATGFAECTMSISRISTHAILLKVQGCHSQNMDLGRHQSKYPPLCPS
jgi:hypothetical protein